MASLASALDPEFAKAKVNLCLHVKGKRADGYHELESLVVFAAVCDQITYGPAPDDSLEVEGAFARALDGENLVLKAKSAAARWLGQDVTGAFRLVKNIPVAAGLGGGSADAAATLRLLFRHFGKDMPDSGEFLDSVAKIGADVPVCLWSKAAWMRGIGEHLTPMSALPPLPAVLVNPRVPLSTRAVFNRLGASPCPIAAPSDSLPFETVWRTPQEAAATLLASARNDLEPPARALEPAIEDVLAALTALPGCLLARLSGSGPTCFGLFATQADACAAEAQLLAAKPNWWAAATTLS